MKCPYCKKQLQRTEFHYAGECPTGHGLIFYKDAIEETKQTKLF